VANNCLLLGYLKCSFLDNISCCFKFLILWPTSLSELSVLCVSYEFTIIREMEVKELSLEFACGVHICR
jgi:hypothetical protein